ncbi:T9SS type A sorting domain-containing protein [Kaistella flava (ex Peng et al. 2021)]|uniref:T9SS type A sorting domain-containing protein n=1 Tax=Kaistella flava (ex Peng et al. 2021) TaxID=2038776 RepID=A0A7M2YA81_9FLAO|nr:T9SS type A sorting domain-containing protein [Kaistella flava (ex Peng et al. 2021)]QOW10484.1 T9SS type A sorting domain-containing protein [Kaistella flava (ex Peng et al. 2021)]
MLQFDYQGIAHMFPEKMEVKIGTATSVAGQTSQLWINEEIGNYPYETATVNFTVPADGVYYLSFRAFSDPNEFYLEVDNVKVFETNLATMNVNKSSLKFFPNPVQDILIITDSKEISSISIFDISGKQVISESAKSGKLELNVSQLKPGMYIVKANSDGVVKTFKFIKK